MVFKYSYLFIGLEIVHPINTYLTWGIEGGFQNCVHLHIRQSCITLICTYTFTQSLLVLLSYSVFFFICINLTLISFKNDVFVRYSYISSLRRISVVMKQFFFTLNCFAKPKLKVLILIK